MQKRYFLRCLLSSESPLFFRRWKFRTTSAPHALAAVEAGAVYQVCAGTSYKPLQSLPNHLSIIIKFTSR